MVDVRLVDLEVIKRYSLAVRRDTVPALELLEALDASRALVSAALEAAGGADPIGGAAAPRSRTRRAPAGDAAVPDPAPGDEGS